MKKLLNLLTVFTLCWMLSTTGSAFAQDAAPAKTPDSAAKDLSVIEQQLFRDYERFEKSLFDVGEQLRRKDPTRAELLYRARSHSQEQNILTEMQTIAELLRSQTPTGDSVDPQYGAAADRQKEVLARMKGVLRLLQAQDERERVAAEIARLQELLKETNRLIARQKDVRADTQRSRSPENQQDAQKKVADEAEKLSQKIDKQDAERSRKSPGQAPESGERKPGDSSEGQPSDSPMPEKGSQKNSEKPQGESPEKDSNGKPESGDQKSDGKSGDESGKQESQQGGKQQGGNNQEGQKGEQGQQGEQSQQQSSSQNQDSQQTQGREQLEQARQEMQQAIERLMEEQKEKAVEKQDQAVNKLEQLKAQLEEILRQLREDEKESYLTMLEARFQNMRRRQQHINTETVRVDGIEAANRLQQNFATQADVIRKEQDDNALDAEKALHLLKEEGSSVAFPEAVEQMHKNMVLVASRLSRQETGQTTQIIEKLVLDTLDEMITALRQELQKQQEKKQQGAQGGQGQPQEPGLINQLAELKLIRSLQNQINVLTRQLGTEVTEGSDGDPDRIKLIQDLQRRQERIQEATYDLSVGRNK